MAPGLNWPSPTIQEVIAVSETVPAAMKVAASTMEFREVEVPDVPSDAALLRVEVAGVCGTDVSQYKLPLRAAPIIMGHENVGYLERVGKTFAERKGVREGDLVFLEHYLPCGQCEWDHMGEYRHCPATDWFYDPKAIRYGYTSIDTPPSLWGGFCHYLYLPHNAVIHKVPDGVTPIEAGTATPMANGVQWALFDGGVGYASTVLIQGPGQQGLSCVMASKHAGADRIIITGTSKDARRLEVAKAMGADDVIDIDAEDPLERIREITGGVGVDVIVDCTVGAGMGPTLLAIEAAKRRGSTMVVQGEDSEYPSFPIGRVTRKAITMKSARGHSYRAVELALHQIASRRFPLELMTTHSFGLSEVDYAIKSVTGQGAPGAIHVSVLPWE